LNDNDILETEIGEGTNVGAVIDGVRWEREPVAVPIDQDEVAMALVGHDPVGRAHARDLPRRKQRGVDDARSADERDFPRRHSAGNPLRRQRPT
jgi:hypothetical protein